MSGRCSNTSSTSDSSFLLHRQSKNPLPDSSTMNCCNCLQTWRDRNAIDSFFADHSFPEGVVAVQDDHLVRRAQQGVDLPGQDRSQARRRTGAYRGCARVGLAAGRSRRRPVEVEIIGLDQTDARNFRQRRNDAPLNPRRTGSGLLDQPSPPVTLDKGRGSAVSMSGTPSFALH